MPAIRNVQAGNGAVDAFLHLQTKRAGKIKGEAVASGHDGDIIVTGWQWGLEASSALGSTQATGRRSYSTLTLWKNADLATTGILSAAATNDEVKEAKLVLRRAGGDQIDFLKITVSKARIVAVRHEGTDDAGLTETVSIAFSKVEVEYTPQKSTGQKGGSAVFNDELVSN